MVVTREDNPPTYDVATSSSGSNGARSPPPPSDPVLKSKDAPYDPQVATPQPPPQPAAHHGMLIAPAMGTTPTYVP
ncbi:hypothetical protein FRC06_003174 [Ceratobasidium sp. 370]|nr:hypothetical protein FRC06_003174 [Ceratobasidium sp. 370]